MFSEATQTILRSDNPELLSYAEAADKFEGYQPPHALKIAELAEKLARRARFGEGDIRSLREAALFHDVGEMVMARGYLSSSASLNVQEKLDLQRHPVIGEQEAARRGLSKAVQLIVRWHHEWWNGTGYPDRLSGEQIPLAARILRIADSYVALTSPRPFREAFSAAEADRYVAEAAGIEFDPAVARLLLSLPERDYRTVSEAPPAREDSINAEESPVEKFLEYEPTDED